MMLSAADAVDRADQMIAIGRRLIALIAVEAEAMSRHRTVPGAATIEEKERLAHTWRIEVQRIKDDPRLLQGIDAVRKEALKTVSRELETQLDAHARALSAMKTVTEGLVRRITEEIAAARRPPPAYGRTGVVESAPGSASGGAAINTRA